MLQQRCGNSQLQLSTLPESRLISRDYNLANTGGMSSYLDSDLCPSFLEAHRVGVLSDVRSSPSGASHGHGERVQELVSPDIINATIPGSVRCNRENHEIIGPLLMGSVLDVGIYCDIRFFQRRQEG